MGNDTSRADINHKENMVGTNLKTETVKLMDRRTVIETEMNAIIECLCQPDGPGLYGNLVDSEGFPRTDIDIPAVSANRRRLAELKNDHKDVTEKINQNILLLHAAKPGPKLSANSASENCMEIDGHVPSTTRSETDAIPSIPFALVDEIAESSPAAEDGLQLGDQILKFGTVESGENLLSMVAQEALKNQGTAIPVAVLRHGAISSVSVTPRTWQGRGLLGCHFKLL